MKGVRHVGARTGCRIKADRQDERAVAGHHVGALVRKIPLKPEVALLPRRCIRRNDGNKERAVADLASDLLIPHVAAAQLALVEPDLDTRTAQRLANAPSRLRVLRGIAQKYSPSRCARLSWRVPLHPERECLENPAQANVPVTAAAGD